MKHLAFCFLALFTYKANAQLIITTSLRQDAVWDENKEEWEVLSSEEGSTLFEFDRELTQFKHTTPSISSVYYIEDWEYNEENVKYTMDVTSDAGNEYELIIDGINNCVAFFYWKQDKYILVRHTIAETRFEE